MKKVLTIALALLVLAAAGIADGFDFSSMTDEELTSLHEQAEQEMINRDLLKLHLYEGEYFASDDIPAGKYDVLVVDLVPGRNDVKLMEFIIKEYNQEKNRWENVTRTHYDVIGQKFHFQIEEGQKLSIYHGEIEIFNYKK